MHKKRTIWLEGAGQGNSLAPHGNSKEGTKYSSRTQLQVLKELKEGVCFACVKSGRRYDPQRRNCEVQ